MSSQEFSSIEGYTATVTLNSVVVRRGTTVSNLPMVRIAAVTYLKVGFFKKTWRAVCQTASVEADDWLLIEFATEDEAASFVNAVEQAMLLR